MTRSHPTLTTLLLLALAMMTGGCPPSEGGTDAGRRMPRDPPPSGGPLCVEASDYATKSHRFLCGANDAKAGDEACSIQLYATLGTSAQPTTAVAVTAGGSSSFSVDVGDDINKTVRVEPSSSVQPVSTGAVYYYVANCRVSGGPEACRNATSALMFQFNVVSSCP